jgi:hypothetical protein
MENENSDKIILGCIGLMVVSMLINHLIPYEALILRTIIGLLWGAIPLALSFTIKNDKLRSYGTAGGVIYLAFQVYLQLRFVSDFWPID